MANIDPELDQLIKDLKEEAAIIESWLGCRVTVKFPKHLHQRPPRKNAPWWSQELMELRQACIRARRPYTRYRRRRHRDENEENQLYEAYQTARNAYRLAVDLAKKQYQQEIQGDLSPPQSEELSPAKE